MPTRRGGSSSAHNTEAERQACQIRPRAERKAGQLLAAMEKAKNQHECRSDDPTSKSTLRDLGVSKQQSSDWQKLAAVPQRDFDDALADRTARPTTAGIIRASAEPKRNPVSNEALWLWGRLLDFERNGMLAMSPAEIMSTSRTAIPLSAIFFGARSGKLSWPRG